MGLLGRESKEEMFIITVDIIIVKCEHGMQYLVPTSWLLMLIERFLLTRGPRFNRPKTLMNGVIRRVLKVAGFPKIRVNDFILDFAMARQ